MTLLPLLLLLIMVVTALAIQSSRETSVPVSYVRASPADLERARIAQASMMALPYQSARGKRGRSMDYEGDYSLGEWSGAQRRRLH